MLFMPCRAAAKRFSARKPTRLVLLLGGMLLALSARNLPAQSLYYATAIDTSFTPTFGGELNDLGQVVGNNSSSTQALSWLPSTAYGLPAGVNNLGTLGGNYGIADGVNSSGQVVGYSYLASGSQRAFLWLPAPAYGLPAGMNDLGTPPGGSAFLVAAYGLNSAGQVVGSTYDPGNNTMYAFLWLPAPAYGLPAGMNNIGLPGSHMGRALAINRLGQVVGYVGNAHASLWLPSAAYGLNAGMNDLGTLSGATAIANSYATGINSLGQVVGFSQTMTGNTHAFLWLPSAAYGLPAGMNDLGVVVGDTNSFAEGINDKGQVVVNGSANGFVWQNGVRTPTTGLPSAINASGQIVSRLAAGNVLLTPIGGPQPDHGGNAPNNLVSVTLVCGVSASVTQAALMAPGPTHAPGTNPGDIIAQYASLAPVDAYSIRATFDLGSAAPGPRVVVVSFSNGTTLTLPFPFTIDNTGNPQISATLTGGAQGLVNGSQQQFLRPGRTSTYQLVLTNTGNVDAVGVPAWIVFPNLPSGSTFDYSNFGLQAPPAIAGLTVNWSNYTPFPYVVVPAGRFPNLNYMLPILIARLPAGASQSLQIKVTPGANFPLNTILPVQVWSNPFYHDLSPEGAQPNAQVSLKLLAELAYTNANTGQAPNDSAFNTAAGKVLAQINGLNVGAYSGLSATGSLTSFAQILDEILLLTPQGQALSNSALQSAVALALSQSQTIPDFAQESFQSAFPVVVSSHDPNGLSGPLGYTRGNTNFVRGDTPLTFTVGFGNSPNAFAAQSVTIVGSLDNSVLDLNRLNIQAITVEGTTGNPNMPAFLQTSAPLTQQSSPITGRNMTGSFNVPVAGAAQVNAAVTASVDLDRGALTCALSTAAASGFLAAGANGSVSFSVPWKAGAPAGATLQTQASITFDNNLPTIAGPLIYVLDNAPPVSAVLPLPALSVPQIPVFWAGADNPGGCGLQDYTVYVSDNGGAYTVWQNDTTATQAAYPGVIGHTYAFLCQSRDNLNNIEPLRTSGDAVTTVARSVTGRIALEGVADLSLVSPYAPLGLFHVSFRKPKTTMELYGYDVALNTTAGSSFGTFSLFNVPAGLYDVTIKGAKSLRVLLPGNSINMTTTLPDAALPAGDANNDNSVDPTDFGIFVGAYNTDGSIPGSGYDARADFNYDGFVDPNDFGILVGEYGAAGAM